MGAVLDSSLFSYVHWMPDEEPTFYIPSSVVLTPEQKAILQQHEVRQGEPFLLTNDGQFTQPQSKRYVLQGDYSLITFKKDSIVLIEEEPGQFSLEFQYFSPQALRMEVFIHAIDKSDHQNIK